MLSMPLGESQDSLAGRFHCSHNFANEHHGDGAKKTALAWVTFLMAHEASHLSIPIPTVMKKVYKYTFVEL